ncbi:MAG TPA: hypothetical protein VHM89_05970 [Acidimicrobiales bacterium]|nr:hypothetical protein [Acidimicrobiales bacterium]
MRAAAGVPAGVRVQGGGLEPARFRAVLVLAVVGVLAYVTWFAWALEHGDYNAWGTMVIAPALVGVSVPMLRRAVRREPDPTVGRIIVVAFFVKLAVAFLNQAVAFIVYGGIADASGYHNQGVRYSEAFRSGHFGLAKNGELGRRFINAVTGYLYTITGPSKFGGYLVFAWFGFWGLYLFYRAFVVAVPEGDHRRYAYLVFLLPSLLFWTSAIGKEAWMTLALGTTSMGAALLLTRRRGGLALVAAGLIASGLCRPHIGVLAFIALMAGYLVRRSSTSSRLGPLATLSGLAFLLAIGSVLGSQFAKHFDLASLDASAVQSTLQTAEEQTAGGGSGFTTAQLPWPLAVPGILVRPLPVEAHNVQTLASSVEGTGMLVLFVASRKRLKAALRRLLANPYVLLAAVYSLSFLLAFASFRNFGTLARERVQVFPLVLVLFAFPPLTKPARVARFAPPPMGPVAARR